MTGRSTPAATCVCTMALTAGASALSPMRPSASAARPCSSGSELLSAPSSAPRAAGSPIRPIAKAAICRTSGLSSLRRSARNGSPSDRPDAADRQRGARAAPVPVGRGSAPADRRWQRGPSRAGSDRAGCADPRAARSKRASPPRSRGRRTAAAAVWPPAWRPGWTCTTGQRRPSARRHRSLAACRTRPCA